MAQGEDLALGKAARDEQEDSEDEGVLDERRDRRRVLVREVLGLLRAVDTTEVGDECERADEDQPRQEASRVLLAAADHARDSSRSVASIRT
jgi:hypothetical protein